MQPQRKAARWSPSGTVWFAVRSSGFRATPYTGCTALVWNRRRWSSTWTAKRGRAAVVYVAASSWREQAPRSWRWRRCHVERSHTASTTFLRRRHPRDVSPTTDLLPQRFASTPPHNSVCLCFIIIIIIVIIIIINIIIIPTSVVILVLYGTKSKRVLYFFTFDNFSGC